MTGYPRQYGKYVLLEPIGAGGMSEVDLAHRGVEETSFVRFVAIKRVARTNLTDEAYVRMFMDEARINAELHHGNIVQVFDFGKQVDPAAGREEYFMVMEYVPGLDLRAIQRAAQVQGTALPPRFCLSVLGEVLNGLQYAHTKVDTLGRPMNLVHRDINPRNVMVSVSGEVKVIDFGVALAEDRLEKTQGRSLKGKFAYMSPEQIEGNVVLDGRTDLYAVGLMLHELIEGKGPFQGLTELQIMHRIVMGQVPELKATEDFPRPDLLRRVHARAIARDRDRRYPDAATFRRDLEALGELAGGLASQDERAALVRSLAPVEVDGIGDRLRQYHDSHSVSRSVARDTLPPLPERSRSDLSLPPTAEATASLGGQTQEYPANPDARAGGGLARLWALVAVILVFGILFLATAGAGVAWWLDRPGSGRDPAPTLAGLLPAADAPAPAVALPGDPVAVEAPGAASGPRAAANPSAGTSRSPAPGDRAARPPGSGAPAPAIPTAARPSEASTVEPPAPPADAAAPEPPAPEPEPTPAPAAPGSAAPATPVDPPAPAEPPAGPPGRLMVTSEIPGQVLVNGKAVGSTPLNIPFPQGTYTIVVVGAGGELCRQQATVSARLAPVLCRGTSKTGEPRDDDDHHQR